MAQNISEQNLTRDELIALRNKRTGMTVFQLSWIMVFICLVVVNLQIRGNFVTWPPEGVPRLEPILPTIVTVLLIISGFTAHRALNAINADARARFLQLWRITLGLGAAFAAVMLFEAITVPESGQYSTLFRVMTLYHFIHALVVGIYMWMTHQRAVRGLVTSADTWSVEAGTKLWYFVIVAWIMFYVVLYML
jgi:heme/copper-type cytochrome/quinol oxidase subunit 3